MISNRPNKTTLVVFVSLLLIFLAVNFWMVAPYLLAVAMGLILAVSTRPVYRWQLKKKIPPGIAAALVTVGISVLVIAPILIFTYLSIQQAAELGQQIASNQNLSFQNIFHQITQWGPVRDLVGDASAVEKQFRSSAQNVAKVITGTLLGIVSGLPEFALNVVLAVLTCYFFLIDDNRFFSWMREKIPADPDVREKLFKDFKETAISSLWATMVAAFVQAALMFFGFLILGIPMAFLAAGITFVFAWIPILGSWPVWIGACTYLYVQEETTKMFIMLGIGVFIGVADNLVRPLVLKGGIKMHPLISLIAIFGGIKQFGLLGVFFGPILFALFLSLMQIWPSIEARFGLRERQTQQPAV